MSSILLKNCFYIFLFADEESRRGEDVLIRENRIAKIGADIVAPADRVIGSWAEVRSAAEEFFARHGIGAPA